MLTPATRARALAPARWSARHPWSAVAGWLVFCTACLFIGSSVGSVQLSEADSGSGESGRADRAVAAGQFPAQIVENVLVRPVAESDPLTVTDAALRDLDSALSASSKVAGVGDPVTSADGRTRLLPVTMAVDGLTGDDAFARAEEGLGAVESIVAEQAAAHPDVAIEQAGAVSINAAVNAQVEADFVKAELLSIPLTLVILLVAFGALLAAGVPVLLALSSVAATIGLTGLVSQLVPTTEALNSTVLLIGMAVGVDYSLFYVRRTREERAAGASTRDSVDIAAATSGRAVLVSGIAVAISMSGLFLAGNPVFTSMAVGTILVVVVSVVGSLTVLPAVLSLLGDHINRPRVPLVWRLQRRHGAARVWPAILRVVLARPAVSLAVGVGVLLVVAAPAVGMSLKQSGPADIPRSIDVMQSYDSLVAAFPEQGTAHDVVVWSDTSLPRADVESAVGHLRSDAAGDAVFAPSDAAVEFSPDGRTARFSVPVSLDPGDPEARATLDELRGTLVPSAFGGLLSSGVQVGVTGMVAADADFSAELTVRLPLIIGFVLTLTFIILVIAFRSLVIAATAVALNLLSVAAAYGLLVLVFQRTWAESLLGFHSSGGVIPWLPLFLFVVLFGLSMDYHVFVVSRIREAAGTGLPVRDAVVDGLTRSAGVVTSAAVIMVGVFSIFGTLSLLEFKQLGVGLAAAILIDATVVRGVLLPSAMVLLGERNWYLPRFLQRLPNLEGSPALVPARAMADAME